MDTPICDFVEKYKKADMVRMHMPGHKGVSFLGVEKGDITEIDGADSLYEASGIIKKSEQNASSLFGAHTFYSAQGSSLSIRAMLYMVSLYARSVGKKPIIAAGRNAHKVFVNTAALLDLDIQWLYGDGSYLTCNISSDMLDDMLSHSGQKPVAVYLTSPDYLGNIADIEAISSVCHKHGVLLVVDNAHGAYLKFLSPSQHPIDLGADMCCDSAHKTLPVLTGGAYLHVSLDAPSLFAQTAKSALALFGSTSPSYLVLCSLDMANGYIADGYCEKLRSFAIDVQRLKESLVSIGYTLYGNEPMKITVGTKDRGYTGVEFAKELLSRNIVCEFADEDFVVFMLTPENGTRSIGALLGAMGDILPKEPVVRKAPPIPKAKKAMSIKDAVFAPKKELPVAQANGRVLASASVSCPPAVPIVACGEIIDEAAIKCFEYYGIHTCMVVDN